MKRGKGLLVFFCLLLILPIAVSGDTGLEEYKPEILVQAKVGPKEGEFGLKEGYDIQTLGVAFFAVSPSGEIYIHDRAKNDIKQFSQTGKFVRAIPLGKIRPGDLKVDPDGKIYLFYDRGYPGEERYFIYQLSPEGKLLATIKVMDTPELGYAHTGRDSDSIPVLGMVSLYLVNRDLYLYDRTNNKSPPLIKNGKVLGSTQIKKGMFEGRLTATGLKWAVNPNGGINLYDQKSKFLKHILPGQRSFIDIDNQGNFYFYDPKGLDKEKWIRKIFKFDQDGKLKAIVERRPHIYASRLIKPQGDIVITSDAIYVLDDYKDKVEVIKYSLSSKPEKGGMEK